MDGLKETHLVTNRVRDSFIAFNFSSAVPISHVFVTGSFAGTNTWMSAHHWYMNTNPLREEEPLSSSDWTSVLHAQDPDSQAPTASGWYV